MSCQQAPPQHNRSDAQRAQAWLGCLINEWSTSQAVSRLHTATLSPQLRFRKTEGKQPSAAAAAAGGEEQ